MNWVLRLFYIVASAQGLFLFSFLHAQAQKPQTVLQTKFMQLEAQDKRPIANKKKIKEKLISFYFDNEDLIDIINFLASQKEVNIVLPMGANAINVKVTLHLEEKVTIDEAWHILYTLLDIAGYSMIAKEDTYNIVRTTNTVTREPLPLYIVRPDELPNSDKRIRYLYYFANIKITDDPNNEMAGLVRDVLPPETASYKLDSQSNSLLLSDKANNIKALMKIITALDQVEAQEKPEIIQLRYVSADVIANIFNEQLLRTAGDVNQMRLGIRPTNNATFFKKVRIVPDMRTNRIIVLGRPQAVERVRDFIHNYIDVELESGKSILHVYQLQYLDAKTFAVTLDRIVKGERAGGTEQSRAGNQIGGAERFFTDVIIRADQTETVSGEQPDGAYRGSNNLIIAARNDDYERIKVLIEELDIPQPQVIIEVLIADLTINDIANLGASLRNPIGVGPDKVNFQSAQATPFLANTFTNPTTIQADLLRRGYNQNQQLTADCDNPASDSRCFSAAQFIAQGLGQGTAVMSFNDPSTGQTWGIGKVRQFIDTKKVLSHPHLITTNNKEAIIEIKEERFARDQGSGSTGGTTTQTRQWIPATLSVKITPRISSAELVNLNVVIDIGQFTSAASNFTNVGVNSASTANRVARNVTTRANVRSGHVLALGGLTRVDTTAEQSETPLLGKIPVIGWFFKNRTSTTNKNNLTVFISPTIIMPRIRGGVGSYTKHHVQLAKSYSREGMLFDNLRDPITRWFFRTQKDDAETKIEDFIAQDEFIAPTLFDVRKEENRSIAQATPSQKDDKKEIMLAHTKNTKMQPVAIVAQAPTMSNAHQDHPIITNVKHHGKDPITIANTTLPIAQKEPVANLKNMLSDMENPFTPKAKA